MMQDNKIRQYFDIKLETLDFLIKNHDDIANTNRAEVYFADLAFFAEFFGFTHDEKFVDSAQKFCKAYNLNIENYDLDIANEGE